MSWAVTKRQVLLGLLAMVGWLVISRSDRAWAWKIPPGFDVSIAAADLGRPAALTFGPDKTLYVTELKNGQLLAIPWRGQGLQAAPIKLAGGLAEPLGVAWYQGSLYVTNTGRITRFRLQGLKVVERKDIVTDLPHNGGHNTDTVRVSADGWLYVTQGSSCNVCVESDPRRATLMRYRIDGSGSEIYARGLRNCFGFDFHPQTKEIWGVDNGRDWLGDNEPPEGLLRVAHGAHFGWPYCYGLRVMDKAFPAPQAGYCRKTTQPSMGLEPHGGAAGVAFYTGRTFPPEFRNNLFVALNGSWNRSTPSGHDIVRIVFQGGQPVRQETFLRHQVLTEFGPVGVAVGPDGALYVCDLMQGGRILRIQYRRAPSP